MKSQCITIPFSQNKSYSSMQKFLLGFALVAASACISPLKAQLLSVNNAPAGDETTKQTTTKQEWSIFTDNENRMAYIDFEKINVNLSGVSVKNNAGEVVFKDETLWQLPVNTIYEVDFSNFPKGEYTIELKSYTCNLNRTITIK